AAAPAAPPLTSGARPWPAALHGGALMAARFLVAPLAYLPLLILAVALDQVWRIDWMDVLYGPNFEPAPILAALGITLAGLALTLPVEGPKAPRLGRV